MAAATLEQRLSLLEQEVARLRARVEGRGTSTQEAWEKMWGAFSGDPAFQEAMRLGRAYRESLRPKPPRTKTGVKQRRKS